MTLLTGPLFSRHEEGPPRVSRDGPDGMPVGAASRDIQGTSIRKTQDSRKAKWQRGPLSSPGQTSPTISRPRETRPVAAMPGPVASGNSRPGRFDPPNSPADDPTTDGLVTGPRIGASLPRNLRTSGLERHTHVCFGQAHTLFGQDGESRSWRGTT